MSGVVALAVRPKRSHPGDGFGAFGPESERFRKLHRNSVVLEVDARKMLGTVPLPTRRKADQARRAEVANFITRLSGVASAPQWLALFCHGWRTGVQLGFDRASAHELARALRAASPFTDSMTVTLYACSTARGDDSTGEGGFADALRDALVVAGFFRARVDAHTTAGHATWNPYVLRFEGDGTASPPRGGEWIVSPTSPLWQRWRTALRSTDLRLRFSLMSVDDVHAELNRVR